MNRKSEKKATAGCLARFWSRCSSCKKSCCSCKKKKPTEEIAPAEELVSDTPPTEAKALTAHNTEPIDQSIAVLVDPPPPEGVAEPVSGLEVEPNPALGSEPEPEPELEPEPEPYDVIVDNLILQHTDVKRFVV